MSNFTRDKSAPLFGILYRSSEFEVEMLEEASCARTHCCKLRCTELAHENCYVVFQHPLWTSYFSLMSLCDS